jgi:hypothetical protein
MLLGTSANVFATLLQEDESNPLNGSDFESQDGASENPPSPSTTYLRLVERCTRQTFEVYRVVRFWAPEFIPLTYPFISCALIGPAAVHVSRSPQPPEIDGKENLRFLQRHLLELVLKHVAEYWVIGSMLQGISPTVVRYGLPRMVTKSFLELIKLIDSGTPIESIAASRPELARFRVMMPDLVKDAPISKLSARTETHT